MGDVSWASGALGGVELEIYHRRGNSETRRDTALPGWIPSQTGAQLLARPHLLKALSMWLQGTCRRLAPIPASRHWSRSTWCLRSSHRSVLSNDVLGFAMSALESASRCSAKVDDRLADTVEDVTGHLIKALRFWPCAGCAVTLNRQKQRHIPSSSSFYRPLPLWLARCFFHSTSHFSGRCQFHYVSSTFSVLVILEVCLQGGLGITRNSKRWTATPGLLHKRDNVSSF
jgi:hypothetical protein